MENVTNFDFIKAQWPQVYADCVQAEGYLITDARSACFYSRRAVEQLVRLIYDVDQLPVPYRDDLAARIKQAAFQQRVGVGIGRKLDLIRRLGNRAVHDVQPIPHNAALDVMRELHHLVVWAAFRYSTNPTAVPMGAVFDPRKMPLVGLSRRQHGFESRWGYCAQYAHRSQRPTR